MFFGSYSVCSHQTLEAKR